MARQKIVFVDPPPEPPKPLPLEILRVQAKQIYATAVERMELVDVWRHPSIRDRVTFAELQIWAREDKWNAERKQLFNGLAKNLEGKLKERLLSQVAQDRIRQKKGLRILMKSMLKKSVRSDVKSADAGARAYAELCKVDNTLNESIAGDLQDVVHSGLTGGPRPLELRGGSREEILKLSRGLLAQRRLEAESTTIDLSSENYAEQPSDPAPTAPTPLAAAPSPASPPLDSGGG